MLRADGAVAEQAHADCRGRVASRQGHELQEGRVPPGGVGFVEGDDHPPVGGAGDQAVLGQAVTEGGGRSLGGKAEDR